MPRLHDGRNIRSAWMPIFAPWRNYVNSLGSMHEGDCLATSPVSHEHEGPLEM